MPLRPMGREQSWILPPSLDELVPADHPVRFVAEFVDGLSREEWLEMGIDVDGGLMGAPSYHPRALLGAWLYGFMRGVRSSRKLEAACREQIPFLWLSGRQCPDHNTLWRFYKGNRQEMRRLLKRTVKTAVSLELVELALQAVDGTKVWANASGDRTLDAEGLRRLLERVEKAIEDMEAQNEGGGEGGPAQMPPELSEKMELRERVRRAMKELEEDEGSNRVNLTDGDARLMKGRERIGPGYNAQAMVSPTESEAGTKGMLITAVAVTTAPNDHSQLVPMLEVAEETTGVRAEVTLADAGYHSGSNLEEGEVRGQQVMMPESQQRALSHPYHKDRFIYDEERDSYECPHGERLRFTRMKSTRGVLMRLYRSSGKVCRRCPAFGVCTVDGRHGRAIEAGPHEGALRRHRELMLTHRAKESYRRRKGLVEPVFGIIKEQLGVRRFLLRGLQNVSAEWSLLGVAFNLRTLWKAWADRGIRNREARTKHIPKSKLSPPWAVIPTFGAYPLALPSRTIYLIPQPDL